MKNLMDKWGKKKVYTCIAILLVLIIMVVVLIVSLGSKPSFTVKAKDSVIAEYGEELDKSQLYDQAKSDKGVSVKEVKDFDSFKIGDQTVTVVFSNAKKTESIKIKVTVKDTVKPEFVDFKKEIVIEENAENVDLSAYFVAKDKAEVTITVDGEVNLKKAGKYDIKVTAEDANKNKTEAQSCVVVVVSKAEVEGGKELTATVKGDVPLSKETSKKVEAGEVKLKVDKPSEAVINEIKEQSKKIEEKKTQSSTDDKKSSENKSESNSTANKTDKPSGGNSSNDNKSDGSSNGSSSNNNSNTKPADKPSTSHEHDWIAVYKTVHHDEVGHNEKYIINDAWDEIVPKYEDKYVYVCYSPNCGYESEDASTFGKHGKQHALKGEDTSYGGEIRKIQVGTETKHHETEYGNKWIVDKEAYDEKVVDYYKCTCGATKK